MQLTLLNLWGKKKKMHLRDGYRIKTQLSLILSFLSSLCQANSSGLKHVTDWEIKKRC